MMTYFNANVYRDSPTAWAHDGCLPDDEFEITPSGMRTQREPWRWAPIYGGKHACRYCGGEVR